MIGVKTRHTIVELAGKFNCTYSSMMQLLNKFNVPKEKIPGKKTLLYHITDVLECFGIENKEGNEPYIRVREVELLIMVEREMIIKMARLNKIPAHKFYKMKEGVWLFKRSEILEWMHNRIKPNEYFNMAIYKQHLGEFLRALLDNKTIFGGMNPTLYSIIEMYFIEKMDLVDIGIVLKRTPERARQLFVLAMKKMTHITPNHTSVVKEIIAENYQLKKRIKQIEGSKVFVNSSIKYRIKLEDVDCSMRLYNVLKKQVKINYLEEVLEYKQDDLRKYLGFGEDCMQDLERVLREYKLHR